MKAAEEQASRRFVYLLLLAQVALSVPFALFAYVGFESCFLTANADGRCATRPLSAFGAATGPGAGPGAAPAAGARAVLLPLDGLFGVRNGQSFMLASSAALFTGFGWGVLRLLNKKTSEVHMGVVIGASLLLAYVGLCLAGIFGALSGVVADVRADDCRATAPMHFFCASGDPVDTYIAITVLASALTVVHIVLAVALWFNVELFLDHDHYEPVADI